ncbi:BamA/TamA family outer membrane protein [Litoribacter ruber]|uniref:BamA/TamA family outer membrane protein n=1 Tax=Litoribacter ruber TaxID=702568 RepID=UPI001BDA00DC|nr:BamA/TamA family outer membrane protein [Litoribacter ruber]MBT0812557.1 BamA/TamA family outer membrane protein [Litoribacter ruber]
MRKFLLWAFFLVPLSVCAQSEPVEGRESRGKVFEKLFDAADGVVGFVSGEKWSFIPAVTYSPETSLGLGVRAIRVFRHQSDTSGIVRPSTLPITFLYTLNRQIILTGELNYWLNENRDFLNARIELTDYPFKFYGIGNDLPAEQEEFYATRYFYMHLNYEREVLPRLYVGPRYEFRADDIYEKEQEGILDRGLVPGSAGQRLSGLGLKVNWDSRNNIFQPTRGSFHQFSYMTFQPFLGSNFTFDQFDVDFRKYVGFKNQNVLALQSWWSFTTGGPPFQHVSLIGGSDLMRGYFEGRYRDNLAMVQQAEYRFKVYRNLGMVAFGSAGQVADRFSTYSFSRMRYGAGVGFRYRLNSEGLNIRLDLAYGDQRAFYFGLNEVI